MSDHDAVPDGRFCEACGAQLGLDEIKCERCGWFTPPPQPPDVPGWASAPPLAVLEGMVEKLLPAGFDVRVEGGALVHVRTMTDGRRLDLGVGERVRVSGGFAPDGYFASGWMSAGAPGAERAVADAPGPPRWRSLFRRKR